jgi:hypothetical protein
MSKPCRYSGGIRTLADLRLRCRVDHTTGCWHWLQALITCSGQPKVHLVHPATGMKYQTSGRRAAVLLATGKEVPKGHVAWPRPCCDSEDCVNPEHARTGPRKLHGEWLVRTGRLEKRPFRASLTRRRLTDEQVAEIRRNPGVSINVFAKRFDISPSVIWSVRNYITYTDVAQRVSVFHLGGIAA